MMENSATVGERGDERDQPAEQPDLEALRRAKTSDDFLVPGPTPTSNEGLRRWGLTWIIFSLLLMLMMAAVSFGCWALARALGIA